MADSKFSKMKVTGVQTTSETRADLTKIVKQFRDEGPAAIPVLFGSHRKAEGVIMPMWMWEELLERLDSAETELIVRQRMANPQLSEPMTSAQFLDLSNKWFAEFEKLNDATNSSGPGVPGGPSES